MNLKGIQSQTPLWPAPASAASFSTKTTAPAGDVFSGSIAPPPAAKPVVVLPAPPPPAPLLQSIPTSLSLPLQEETPTLEVTSKPSTLQDELRKLAQLPENDPFDWKVPCAPSSAPIEFPCEQPVAIMHAISGHVHNVACIVEGLADQPTMTTGTKTRDKIFTQLQMMEQLAAGDYDTLYAQVRDDKKPDALKIAKSDIESLLKPLTEGLTPRDWRILGAVGTFHDLGKVRQDWAREQNLDLTDFEGIAHDFDSEALLKHNPELLEPFGLSREEKNTVQLMCRLHSLPGMHALGEGNASAYEPLFARAREGGSENLLKLVRIQGMLDVMSSLGTGFLKPILNSHVQLSHFVTEAFHDRSNLAVKYRADSSKELTSDAGMRDVAGEFGIGPVAMKRLRLLTSPKADADTFRQALKGLDPQFTYWFNRATDDQETWFGTYVQSAFGGGLIKAGVEPQEAIQAVVKVVSCAAFYHRQMESYHGVQREWSLSAFEPQLVVKSGAEGTQKILDGVRVLTNLEDGVKHLTGAGVSGLTMRSGKSGVEIAYLAPAAPGA